VKAVVGLVVPCAVVAAFSCAAFQSPTVSSSRIAAPTAIADTLADAPPTRHPRPDSNGVVDLYGNEVDTAIATYSLDPSGNAYEVHSPQTELPRLAAPKS